MCNAGDNIVHYYDIAKSRMEVKRINEVPAAGVFPSFMIDGDRGYKQVPHVLKKGDILFLFTDGIEEAQRRFRDRNFKLTPCDDTCYPPGTPENERNHVSGTDFEEFGISRIQAVIEAVMSRGRYELIKYHNPQPDRKLTFDFSNCEGTEQEAVLALVAAEKIFRLIPDPECTAEDRIMIDNKVDDFLKNHFDQYREYFKYAVPNEEYSEYTYYTHLKEDEQFDDLTILVIRKK